MNSCNNCPAGQTPYVIRRGDTLWAISRRYGTTVEGILAVNPSLVPENLEVGRQICLPYVPENYPNCSSGNYFVVEKGMTFTSIADYFGVSFDMLYKSNMGIDPDVLFAGQVLCIPVAPSPVELLVGKDEIIVRHKNGTETRCPVLSGTFAGKATVINKQLDIGTSGARILDLSDGGAISGRSSRYGGVVVPDAEMDTLFNLTPVGACVTGQQ